MCRSKNGYTLASAGAAAIACALMLGVGAACAQDARIENITVTPRDPKTATVKFDIAWDNSWRDKTNHDAAWVFFKVRAEGSANWQHVRLVADKVLNPTGYSQEEGGTPLDFIVPDGDDGLTGMFVRRAAEGKGPLAASGVTAVWDSTASKGITKDLKGVSIRAFGIEMVYVAEGPFSLGSGGTDVNGFYKYTDGSQATLPYRVTSAGPILTGQQNGKLWAWKGAQPEDGGEIPAAFPNGYGAFYCMKYRLSRAEYAGFMNTLTPKQAEGYVALANKIRPDRIVFATWKQNWGKKAKEQIESVRSQVDGLATNVESLVHADLVGGGPHHPFASPYPYG